MKTIFLSSYLILGTILAQCNNASNSKLTMTFTTDKYSILSTDTSLDSFPQFWHVFRKAIIENDTNKIIEMTTFPFETRGPMDNDKVVTFSKNGFTKVLNAYLKENIYSNSTTISTNLDLIIKTETPDKQYITDTWARVGKLEFHNKKGQWFLKLIYLEYPTINNLKK
jgi:hypothetical protein